MKNFSPEFARDYSAGPNDLLSVTVLEAPELSRSVRVSASGGISLPLIGVFQVAGLAPRAIEVLLEDHLRKTYLRDPHVSVQVLEMQSHSISVMGAVNKPGTFQIQGARTLLEVLSLAGGLAANAGDSVIIMRGSTASEFEGFPDSAHSETGMQQAFMAGSAAKAPSPTEFVEVRIKDLIQAKDPEHNVLVFPGDIVKVVSVEMVYVVGEIRLPGAFPMSGHEQLTVLRALALSQGLKPTAAAKEAKIIRTLETGSRLEVPINMYDILKGKAPDVALQARDIVFVPNSMGKSAALFTADALVRMISLRPYVP